MLSMEVFVAAVDLGSFTAAANAFRMTPAMVSRHVTALEKRIGATLLTRTTRRQNLTEIGRSYYENCKQILAHVAAAETGAQALGSSPRGMLRINAPVSFGSLRVASVASRYLHRYPEVRLQLSLTDRYVDIVEEGFDVAVRVGDLGDSSLIARKLCMFELAVCAAPAYLATRGLPRTPDDLLDHECLGFTNWRSQSGWKMLQKQSTRKAGRLPRFESDNSQALRAAALEGVGIIMMPKDVVQPDIEAGALVEILKTHLPPARPIHAIYPKDRQSAPKVSTFVDFLVDELRPAGNGQRERGHTKKHTARVA